MKYEKDIKLFIDEDFLNRIKECVKNASPNEACGLIFGQIKEHRKPNNKDEYSYLYYAYKFECIESSQKSPVAFLMDDYSKLIKLSNTYSKEFNYQLLSIFHSHPGHPYPSGVDIPYMEGYYKSGITKFKHLIWTIMDANNEELNGFIYIFDEIRQILIQIREN